ncbi:MAG: hypothetical protein LAN61_11280 [Acidobacteriia bacterium]|nr:hypothetical protein [Terriglobia bacterium]
MNVIRGILCLEANGVADHKSDGFRIGLADALCCPGGALPQVKNGMCLNLPLLPGVRQERSEVMQISPGMRCAQELAAREEKEKSASNPVLGATT